MRQTDSLSFVSQYFNNGFDFFNPQLYNLKNIDGRAACEFPITYYLTSLLYFAFGKEVFLLRLLHLLIVFTGVFCIFRLSYHILKDYIYAALISLFLFTSTVFNFYSINYLPDAPALGFTFIGWFFIYKYSIDHKNKTLLFSFLFFTLGSLIKVTYLINPLTVIVFSFYYIVLKNSKAALALKAKKIIFIGVISVAIVIAWNAYILYYNDLYHSSSFNTKALPIWILSLENIIVIWDYMNNYWYNNYFAQSSFHLLFLLLLLQIIFFKKTHPVSWVFTLILFLGSLAFFMLFYTQFKDHDYYFLTFFPFILLILIRGIKTLQNISLNKYFHMGVQLTMVVIVISGINYSRSNLFERYIKDNNEISPLAYLIQKNSKAIKKLNIPEHSRFIVAPDASQNGGLLFLDKMGWNIEKAEDISIAKINHYSNLGAEYILLATSEKEILNIGEATGTLIFEGKGISIFKTGRKE